MILSSSQIGLPATAADGATITSNTINAQGLTRGAVGLQSDHGGTLRVQRYVDSGGVVPLGAVISVPVVAATPISVGWSDGLPCGSFIVSFVNNAGAVAHFTNVAAGLSP